MFRLRRGYLFAAALVLGGCVETTQVITLNPDGSGNVVIDQLMATPDIGATKGRRPDPDQKARQTLGGMLAQAHGVEAWSDVSYAVQNDGRVRCKATGYFKDINSFHALPGKEPNEQVFKWAKSDKGGMEFTVVDSDQPKAAPPALTEAQVKDKVKELRMQYQQQKPLTAMMLGTLKVDLTFQLPGAVQETNNFRKTDRGVQMVVEGQKMIGAMDKAMADDQTVTAMARNGKSVDDQLDNFNELMFGSKGAIMARVTGDLKPQFDYAAEMGKAKIGQEAMLKKLGVEIKEAVIQLDPD